MSIISGPGTRRGELNGATARTSGAKAGLFDPQEIKRYLLVSIGFVASGVLLALVDEWWRVSHLAAANALLMLAAVTMCFLIMFRMRTAAEGLGRATAPSAFDRVTGLPDEQYFWTRFREEYRRATRRSSPISLTLVDVNGLSEVNKMYGRAGGDAVLKHVAQMVESTKRATDVAARLSDDEIAVILLDCGRDGVGAYVARLEHLATKQRPVIKVKGQEMTVWAGVSMGTASALEGESSPEELAARARSSLDLSRDERDRRRANWRSA